MENKNECVLPDLERDLLQELDQRAREAAVAAAAPFQNQAQGILMLIVRREKLAGVWDLNLERTKLVKHEDNN